MVIAELKPGVYRLTKHVKNPEADRRVARDWRKEVMWEKGQRFIVQQDHTNPKKPFFEILFEGYNWSHKRITEFMPGFLPLVEAFEPVAETLDTVLTGQIHVAYSILGYFIEKGKISLADVKDALGEIG